MKDWFILKLKEKEESIILRQQGISVCEISKILNVSKGSISRWVSDVVLTKEQNEKLKNNQINTRFGNNKELMCNVALINSKRYYDLRKKYQDEGRKLFDKYNKDVDFISGLMLYWAEGTKSKNCLSFVNSDSCMVVFFVNFLRKYFFIIEQKIECSIQYYTNNGYSKDDIEKYWMNLIGLDISNMRKCYVDYRPVKSMGRKVGKCPYGICRINYSSVELIQKVYGALKAYLKITDDRWL